MNPTQAVENFWQIKHPALTSKRALLAVSGGADSLALLHAMLQLQARQPEFYFEVAHIDHQIRASAQADAEFVKLFCQQQQIPFHLLEYAVPDYAQKAKISLEDAARRVRYKFFAELGAQLNLPLVLTAHNADDQAETVLMRLLRGAGLNGLAGIPQLSNLPTFAEPSAATLAAPAFEKIIVGRPLLSVYRTDIEAYCAENKLSFRQDETNFEADYTRNKLRLNLLPLLQEVYQPAIKPLLNRLANLARDEEELLAEVTRREFATHAKVDNRDKQVVFERDYWLAQPVALQRRLLRLAWQNLKGNLTDVSFDDVEAARLFLYKPQDGRKILSAGLLAFSDKLQIGLFQPVQYANLPAEGFWLTVPGVLQATDSRWTLEARLLSDAELNLLSTADKYHALLDYAKIGEAVVVRKRIPGDRYRPLGAPGRRKVQDIMVDVRIPREMRDSWPVVAHPLTSEICWIPGTLIADNFKITPDTTHILELIFSKNS